MAMSGNSQRGRGGKRIGEVPPSKEQAEGDRDREESRRGLIHGRAMMIGAVLSTGFLTFLAFPTAWAPEFNLFYLIWVSHIPLLLLIEGQSPRRAAWLSFLSGLVINGGGYYWIGELILTFGQQPLWVAGIGLLFHSAWLACLWGAWGALYTLLRRRLSVAAAAPLAMVVTEHFWPRLFTAYMGNSQFPFPPIMQIVDLLGVPAVTYLIYRFNGEITQWIMTWRPALSAGMPGPRAQLKRSALLTGALIILSLTYGMFRIAQIDGEIAEKKRAGEVIKVGVVEGNVGRKTFLQEW